MSELDYISVRGFKSIRSIEELELGPLTVLIGPNGSGKSNFVGVFSFLNALRESRLREYVIRAGGADKVLHFGSRVTKQLHIHISFQNEVNQYQIELEPNGSDELFPRSEFGFYWNKARYPDRPYPEAIDSDGQEAGISREVERGVRRNVQRHLDSWRLYHFHDTSAASPMKKTANVNDNRYLRTDGSNLAAFLYLLQGDTKTPML